MAGINRVIKDARILDTLWFLFVLIQRYERVQVGLLLMRATSNPG